MNSILPIMAGAIFVGSIFDLFNNQNNIRRSDITCKTGRSDITCKTGKSDITGKTGRSDITGKTGRSGTTGTRYIIKQGSVIEKDGQIYIKYPEYIELRDGKWIPDGRNWKHI